MSSARPRRRSSTATNGRSKKFEMIEISEDKSDFQESKAKRQSRRKSSSRANEKEEEETEEKEEEEDDDDEEEEEEEELYEIEAIRNHRQQEKNLGKIEYLIKWKGYPEKDNTWEPEENAENSKEIIDIYWKSIPSRSQPRKFATASKKRPSSNSDSDDEEVASVGDDDEEEEDKPRSKKKAKIASSPAASKSKADRRKSGRSSKATEDSDYDENVAVKDKVEEEDEDEDGERAEILDRALKQKSDEYEELDSWEDMVETVMTMEKGDDQVLVARIRFKKDPDWTKKMLKLGFKEKAKSGPDLWFQSKVANEKCPQKMLKFYEDHLRFSKPFHSRT